MKKKLKKNQKKTKTFVKKSSIYKLCNKKQKQENISEIPKINDC